jgi:hypothetical protein
MKVPMDLEATLRQRILSLQAHVAVVGQGYVGLSLPVPPPRPASP